MNNNQVQNVSMALLFVIIFLSGYWLSRERKPYSMLLLTIHKLIAVGAFVALIITTVRANRAGELRPASIKRRHRHRGLFPQPHRDRRPVEQRGRDTSVRLHRASLGTLSDAARHRHHPILAAHSNIVNLCDTPRHNA